MKKTLIDVGLFLFGIILGGFAIVYNFIHLIIPLSYLVVILVVISIEFDRRKSKK